MTYLIASGCIVPQTRGEGREKAKGKKKTDMRKAKDI